MADSERRGVLEALQTDEDMLLILTDSMAAKATTINLATGAAPRPQIEQDIKTALRRRQALSLDTGITWVRAHIGIRGNELADQHATFQSWLGEVSGAGARRTATEGGIRRVAKAARKEERSVAIAGYGLGGKVQWGRRAWRLTPGSEQARDHNDNGSTRSGRQKTHLVHAEQRYNQANT